MRKVSQKRRGTVAMEYVIMLGTSVIMSGVATGTAMAAMEHSSVATITAAAMSADFTQAAAEQIVEANLGELNEYGLAVYGANWSTPPAFAAPSSNSAVEDSSITQGPDESSALFTGLSLP